MLVGWVNKVYPTELEGDDVGQTASRLSASPCLQALFPAGVQFLGINQIILILLRWNNNYCTNLRGVMTGTVLEEEL
jgi:hypothetical protein